MLLILILQRNSKNLYYLYEYCLYKYNESNLVFEMSLASKAFSDFLYQYYRFNTDRLFHKFYHPFCKNAIYIFILFI